MKPGFNYFIKWSRGVKVATTKPVTASKEHVGKAGLPIGEKISLLVTLYREDGKRFDPKEAKLSIVAVNPSKKQERTVAKTKFDLSTFAGVPTASSNKVFKLADKYSIRAVVDSRFLKAGGSGPGSAGASSALSGMTGVSGRSSDDDDDPDEFDDLAVDEVPEPEVISIKSKRTPPNTKVSSSSRVPLVVEAPSSTQPSSATTLPKESTIAYERPAPLRTPSSLSSGKRETSKSNEINEANAEKLAATEAKLAKLARENEQLQRSVEAQREERRISDQSYDRKIDDLQTMLKTQQKEHTRIKSQLDGTTTMELELTSENKSLHETVSRLHTDIDRAKKDKDVLEAKCRRLDEAEEKNRELAREVDRLTVLSAKSSDDSSSTSVTMLEERMNALRSEKENLERKVKSHESHATKVKSTYEHLSKMYNGLREQNVKLQDELEEEKTKAINAEAAAESDDNELSSRLKESTEKLSQLQTTNRSLKRDHSRYLEQVTSLQDQVKKITISLEESKEQCKAYKDEKDNLKKQLDETSSHLASKQVNISMNKTDSAKIEQYEEELRSAKNKFEKEREQLKDRIDELESEITGLREDVDYEKAEKMKAREERDTLRETARSLERRTSQAAKHSDDVNSLRRQVSMHQRRESDQEAMIADLQRKIKHLQKDLEESKTEPDTTSSGDDVSEVLQVLVATKLALAEAEDEKLQLQFDMKNMRKGEKAIQQKLAAHASRLEVKLGQANEELEKVKKEKRLESATEFNDLGSDVDY